MLNQQRLMVILAAVLTTAAETEPAPFPESAGYMAAGCDMNAWEIVKRVLTEQRLATFAGHDVRLTARGREIAVKCNGVC